jgi:hypothetical protein
MLMYLLFLLFINHHCHRFLLAVNLRHRIQQTTLRHRTAQWGATSVTCAHIINRARAASQRLHVTHNWPLPSALMCQTRTLNYVT